MLVHHQNTALSYYRNLHENAFSGQWSMALQESIADVDASKPSRYRYSSTVAWMACAPFRSRLWGLVAARCCRWHMILSLIEELTLLIISLLRISSPTSLIIENNKIRRARWETMIEPFHLISITSRYFNRYLFLKFLFLLPTARDTSAAYFLALTNNWRQTPS